MKLTEKQIQTNIIQAINYSGKAYVWNVNAGKAKVRKGNKEYMINLAPTGHSDIQGIRRRDGKFIAIEVKRPTRKNKTTEAQELFLEEIKNYGGVSGVATTPEEALEIIKEEA